MIKLLLFILFQFYFCDKNININNSNIYINKKNVIISIIENYSLDIIFPFFASLVNINLQNCDIIIFVKNVSLFLLNFLKSNGIYVHEISGEYSNVSITNLRWKLYADFLKEKKSEYKLVFIADIRDTIFQKDIFQYYQNYKPFIGISIEDGNLNETSNRIWITNYVGEEKHEIIKNERIICLGTIWGTLDKILELSNIFWEKLEFNTNSTDQGVANYLFYYEKIFNDCLIKSDNFGPVMTIGLSENKNIILDNQNNVLNFKGEIASVVHQYDRKPHIVMRIINKLLYFYNKKINNEFNKIKQSHIMKENKTKSINTIKFLSFLECLTIILLLKKSKMK